MLLRWFILLFILDICRGQACDSVLTGRGVIKSEGHPAEYPSKHDCTWTIEARDYDTVDIRFIDFNIEPGESCEFDYLEVTAEGNAKKFCGDGLRRVGNNGRLQLKGTVVLRLVSDDSINLRGIYLEYQVIPGVAPPTTPAPTTPSPTTPPPGTTCDDEPCLNGATCFMDGNDFLCFCADGFEGNLCEINVDECESDPCENGGTCVDGANRWRCECVPGYIGETCAIDYNECRSNPCQNGGTCDDRLNLYRCLCLKGWTGVDCSIDINECEPNPCRNYGVCEDHLGYHTCICHPSYTGQNCTILIQTTTTTATTTASTTTTAATTTTPITQTITPTTTTPATTTPTTTTPTTTTTITTTTTTATTAPTTKTTPVAKATTSIFTPDRDPNNNPIFSPPLANPTILETTTSIFPTLPTTTVTTSSLLPSISSSKMDDSSGTAPVTKSPLVENSTSKLNSRNESLNGAESTTSAINSSINLTTPLLSSSSVTTEPLGQTSTVFTSTAGNSEKLTEDILIGSIIGILLVAVISMIALYFYLKSVFLNQKIHPSKQQDHHSEKCLENQTMSPTSTDSGISHDTENQIATGRHQHVITTPALLLNETMANKKHEEENNVPDKNGISSESSRPRRKSTSSFQHLPEIDQKPIKKELISETNAKDSKFFSKALPSIFSPRPSPVTSPSHLSPLKEELKIVEEGTVLAAPIQASLPPSTYQNFSPEATAFTFQSQLNKGNDAKPKRKRKSAQRSRGPRPKTAALSASRTRNKGTRQDSASYENPNSFRREETSFNQSQLKPERKASPIRRPLTVDSRSRPSHLQQTINNLEATKQNIDPKESGFRADKPPLFLSQVNKKLSVRFSTIERVPKPKTTEGMESGVSSGTFYTLSEKGDSYPTRISPDDSYSRDNKNCQSQYPSSLENSIPAHSIEEAFESRIPQGFTIQRRRRLSPLTIHNDKFQKPKSDEF